MARRESTDRTLWLAVLAGVLAAAAALWVLRDGDQSPPSPAPDDDPRALAEAYSALETIGLALERHREEAGSYPDELAGLVPRYLARLPADPFRPDAPPAYAGPPGNPEGRILYSLGPDGIDQGGAPLDPVTKRGDLPYLVR